MTHSLAEWVVIKKKKKEKKGRDTGVYDVPKGATEQKRKGERPDQVLPRKSRRCMRKPLLDNGGRKKKKKENIEKQIPG